MFKKFSRVLASVAMIAILASCGSKKTQGETETLTVPTDSILILYYSQTGNTREVANAIKLHLGDVDMAEIVPVNPYDGDYDTTIERWKAERDSNITVEIEPVNVDLDKYSTIFLGFPIWGGTYALPVKTYLENNSLAGKKIITFATFGSGGLDNATNDVALSQPEAEVLRGYGVRASRVGKAFGELDRFLIENNYKEGILETLGDYSEPETLNQEAIEIFEAACSGYKYPLGTPQQVSSRQTSNGTHYRYEVENVTPDGEKSTATIYIVKENGDSVQPEFTEVVRH